MQEGSRHGAKAKAGRQGMARQNKAVVANTQQADEVAGTGLVANSRQMKLASLLPCSKKQQADEMAGTLPCNEEVGGGSAVVLATRKASSDLPYCLPPNLSPLPVSVHTHSLNLSNPI